MGESLISMHRLAGMSAVAELRFFVTLVNFHLHSLPDCSVVYLGAPTSSTTVAFTRIFAGPLYHPLVENPGGGFRRRLTPKPPYAVDRFA